MAEKGNNCSKLRWGERQRERGVKRTGGLVRCENDMCDVEREREDFRGKCEGRGLRKRV